MKLISSLFLLSCYRVGGFQVETLRTSSPTLERTASLSSRLFTSSTDIDDECTRDRFLHNVMTAATTIMTTSVISSAPVLAKDTDLALKGTKKDPDFEACLSQCMYECTKPKGYEQKSRSVCLPECKQQCAKTKEQLLKGLPIKKDAE